MIDVFLSYRTCDEPVAAAVLDRELSARLGRDRVFRDQQSIPAGTRFPERIWKAIGECRVLVAVIGPRWLARGDDGVRYVDRPEDYVRQEIAGALRRDVFVVPVLVGDRVNLPDPAELPDDLRELPSRQGRTLRVRDVDRDAAAVADDVMALLGGGGGGGGGGEAQAAAEPDSAGATYTFHAPVDAPKAVFGTVNRYR